MNQFNRQLDIINPDFLNKRILVIGAGGIGSWTTLALAKMGCRDITVMDYDIVSTQNINSQIYSWKDIGRTKCEALADTINTLVSDPNNAEDGYMINTIEQEWVPGMELKYEIVISALDSMETRIKLWEDIKVNPFILHYIDGRMGGEYFKVLYLNLTKATMSDYEKYQKTMGTGDEVDPTPCTEKAIAYNVFNISSIICSYVKKISKDEWIPFEYAFDIRNLNVV